MDTVLSPFRCIERQELVGCGAAVIEIVATLLTVKSLVPMSGLEQAVPKVDWLLSV